MTSEPPKTSVLYLAPWIDYGGSDKGTIDWFRHLDRGRFEARLVCTQPSPNRRLHEVGDVAEETWVLPDLMDGGHMPRAIFDLIATREIDVLHIMNSRLAFDLLPDLASLPRTPKVVVQLHVEEQDRSGYVRLVCRRYGNLVDAFSVTSDHLADIVVGYDVPRSKVHVIRTGVDAEDEFSPERVTPVSLPADRFHVLYPGRLVEQKDPLLMVQVLRRVAERRPDVLVHVVGFGPLEDAVRAAIEDAGLAGNVAFRPPTNELARWFAACDALLMTSVFEGVPYVAYEALAMGVPVVAPALAGNVELLRDGGGVLIDPRDDDAAYAEALLSLIDAPDERRAMGESGRTRALGELSVGEMTRAHERLYTDLAARLPAREAAPAVLVPERSRLARSPTDRPMVSVVTPCFNHGRFLLRCLDAIRAQSYDDIEMIVVDDASTDPDTITVLDDLEDADDVRVVRTAENRGPSAARNAGLDLVRGAFVLPVDADNLLLPDAVSELVDQLSAAGDDVGFIYPSFHYFGNRRERFDAPAFNPVQLLEKNFCDTCSLFDGRLFTDLGIRFAEDIRLGHEDWDLVLQIIGRGIEGRPSVHPVMYYRKSGFTRSDEVDHQNVVFSQAVKRRHPELFGIIEEDRTWWGWHRSPTIDLKARWSPGLTIAPLARIDPDSDDGRRLRECVGAQTCQDVEILVRSERPWTGATRVRHLPAQAAEHPAAAFEQAIDAALAPFVLVIEGTALDALCDPTFVEKALRSVLHGPHAHLVAYCDAGLPAAQEHGLLGAEETAALRPHAVMLRRDAKAPPPLPETMVAQQSPVASVVAALNAQHGPQIAWRHLPGKPVDAGAGAAQRAIIRLTERRPATQGEMQERATRYVTPPALPNLSRDHVRRWLQREEWSPTMSQLLVRHRHATEERWQITIEATPPPGYVLDRVLGAIHIFQPPGTAQLRAGGEHGFHVIPDTDEGAPIPREPPAPDVLGAVEQTAYLLLDPLFSAYHRRANQHVIVAGDEDPLRAEVEVTAHLGWAEPYPLRPRHEGVLERHLHGFLPLVRALDLEGRRHRYGLGHVPDGKVTLEIGALHSEAQPGSVPAWIEDDRLICSAAPVATGADASDRLRWTVAPLTWRGTGVPLAGRLRATARRSLMALHDQGNGRPRAVPAREPDGFLWGAPDAGRRPVYAAVHPVNGDQLLTFARIEATDLGYGPPALLGYASFGLSLTGDFAPRGLDIPWASRFGRGARHEDPAGAT